MDKFNQPPPPYIESQQSIENERKEGQISTSYQPSAPYYQSPQPIENECKEGQSSISPSTPYFLPSAPYYQPSAPPFQENIIHTNTPIQTIPYVINNTYPGNNCKTYPIPTYSKQTITTPIPCRISNVVNIPNSFNISFGVESINCQCQFCNVIQYTKTKKKFTWRAHLSSLLCILCGCFYGCCLIPYCIDNINITKHYCRNCRKYLGSSQPNF